MTQIIDTEPRWINQRFCTDDRWCPIFGTKLYFRLHDAVVEREDVYLEHKGQNKFWTRAKFRTIKILIPQK